MFDDILKEYSELEAELARRVELSAPLRPKFHAAFQSFFDKHPDLSAITFTAYTPYFNDGDECIYGVNEPEMSAMGFELESWDAAKARQAAEFQRTGEVPADVREAFKGWASSRYDSPEAYLRSGAEKFFALSSESLQAVGAIGAEYNAIQEIVSAVPDDVMKGMFGDHVKVVIGRESVETEEYDHD